MLSKPMESLLNTQIRDEFFASHLYLSMSAYCHNLNFRGFASWMKAQSDEERGHALKLFDYVVSRSGTVALQDVRSPNPSFKSIAAMVEAALAHEQKVTASIHKIYEAAQKEKDHATAVMLQWFISEQVEEEALFQEVLGKLALIPEKSSAILYLDKEMGKRGSSS